MSIPSENGKHYPIGLHALKLDGTLLTSNTKCDLKIKNIPKGAKEAYKFKEIKDISLVYKKISINKQGK